MKRLSGASLSQKISLLILIMVIASTSTIGVLSYYIYRRDSISVNADKAAAIAQTLASTIDAEQMTQILSDDQKTPYWYEVKRNADDIKVRTGAMYLYILDKNYDSDVHYFLEGAFPDETDWIDLGERESVDYHADELFETLATGKITTSDIYDSEGYGMMVSGFAPILNGNTVAGVVGIDISVDDVLYDSRIFGIITAAFVAVFSAIFSLVSWLYVRRNIGRPIAALSDASEKIAVGDMNVALTAESNDEIGRLTTSFQKMIDSTNLQIKALETLSAGDLTAQITPRSSHDTMSLALKNTIENLNTMFRGIGASTANVAVGAAQIASASQNLAQASAEQTATVELLEDTVADIAKKTRDNAAMTEKAAGLSGTIKDNAEKSSLQMDKMIQAVHEISDASQSIGKVIKTIDDIAFQTNILALNAAVEAARAGQHGKGFAVVADEVRNLANKSAEAAKDTGSLIGNSIEKSQLGAQIADATAASLAQIVAGIDESSRIMSEIARFTDEQRTDIDKINSNIDSVVNIIQQNSATAQESAASSEELSGQSQMLQDLINQFRLRQ